MKTVEAFLENNPSYEIAVSGTNVMIVDTKIADAASLNFGVLTFDLASGSTVSVVGILPHPHHPAAAAA
jgi:crotonobetainyl-CoA:carnitine CoA-transferase CaiB-like acyl-CoA transferase